MERRGGIRNLIEIVPAAVLMAAATVFWLIQEISKGLVETSKGQR